MSMIQSNVNLPVMVKEFFDTKGDQVNRALNSTSSSCPFINYVRGTQLGGFLSDLVECSDRFLLIVETPGVEKENLDIKISGNILTIKAMKTPTSKFGSHSCDSSCKCDYATGKSTSCSCDPPCGTEAKFEYKLKEINNGKMERSWANLPSNCDFTKVSTIYSDGTLILSVPKVLHTSQFRKLDIN